MCVEENYTIQRDGTKEKVIFVCFVAPVRIVYELCHLQWLIWWTPLAGNHLHEFKAAVVQLNVCGVVVLCVDLARPQRATVFGLNRENKTKNK